MRMRLLVAAMLAVAGPGALAVADEPEGQIETAGLTELFGPELGRFAVTNWVMRGPGSFTELNFEVETVAALGGAGLRTVWRDAGSGAFFGEITRTLDPDTGEVVQHWFAASSGQWSRTRQQLHGEPDGHGSAFSGEDGYGPFEARTRTVHHADGHYSWTIERRYTGTDWFLVDRGEAIPLAE